MLFAGFRRTWFVSTDEQYVVGFSCLDTKIAEDVALGVTLVPEVFVDFSPWLAFAALRLWFSHLVRRKIKKSLFDQGTLVSSIFMKMISSVVTWNQEMLPCLLNLTHNRHRHERKLYKCRNNSIINNFWVSPSKRILQIKVAVIHQNWRLRWITSSEICRIL